MDQLNKSTNFLDLKFDLNIDKNKEQIKEKNKEEKKEEIKEINEKTDQKEKKVSNKCSVCKKKLSLAMNFNCPCDDTKTYCITHMYPEAHECTRKFTQVKLEKVVADKLNKI